MMLCCVFRSIKSCTSVYRARQWQELESEIRSSRSWNTHHFVDLEWYWSWWYAFS